ncbi:hypothetical protein UFOVP1666_193 [uncultured Caudovirales phage]|uniref:Uncharacterized protein n=1 Tax=uncultured Caudovirales phage TaxID=2100421 RepID=A0A6J5Q6M2_9CAUD|nr:hypothetical protein UFOVP867_148 [uncultured Caudovirales phage]CAB4170550.1 hypothetical protein UFOVP913_50 [uncultured Caudovirales phage]CAB4176965.1 hypothetical protein UFOVP993_103 [uncultured Caudovirales phage]CAB4223397.1 hypothetical protein UFOVP1666_193 [uncultured Caudovirales phage]
MKNIRELKMQFKAAKEELKCIDRAIQLANLMADLQMKKVFELESELNSAYIAADIKKRAL